MSLDVSPDGQTLVFDLLGDLYTMPIAGGKATRAHARHGLRRAAALLARTAGSVLFVSDRDGGWNLWTISLDKRDTVQLTRGKTNAYYSPTWTPDGKYIVATRGTKLWLYSAEGGTGQQLVRAGAERRAARLAAAGPATTAGSWAPPSSRDGRWVWFAQRAGTSGYNTMMGDWQLYAYDRESGRAARARSAGAPRSAPRSRPTGSGSSTARATSTRRASASATSTRATSGGSRARCSATTQESSRVARPVPRHGVHPRLEVPRRDVERPAVEAARRRRRGRRRSRSRWTSRSRSGRGWSSTYRVADSSTFVVKQIRDAVPSPDGRRLAFVALDRLYVMDMPAPTDSAPRTPRRLTDLRRGRRVRADVEPRRPVARVHDVVRRDRRRVVQGAHRRPHAAAAPHAPPAPTMPSPRGRPTVAASSPCARRTARSTRRSRAASARPTTSCGFRRPAAPRRSSRRAASTATRTSRATRRASSSTGNGAARVDALGRHRHQDARARDGAPRPGAAAAGRRPAVRRRVVLMSPSGEQALAQVGSDLFVVTIPTVGGTEPTITVGGTGDATFPARRLTDIGGQFPSVVARRHARPLVDRQRARRLRPRPRPRLRRLGARRRRGAARPTACGRDRGRGDAARRAFRPFEFRMRVTAHARHAARRRGAARRARRDDAGGRGHRARATSSCATTASSPSARSGSVDGA